MDEYAPGSPFDTLLDCMRPDKLSLEIRDLYTDFESNYKWDKATHEEEAHEPL